MMATPALMVIVAFTFASAIFYTLLGVERRIWRLGLSETGPNLPPDQDVRLAHRMLRHLSGWLPPANGVVILLGLPGLIWQGFALNWSIQSVIVLAFWFIGQLWIIAFGRIAILVQDLRAVDGDADIGQIARIVGGLIRQHFNGLLHAAGTLLLEVTLIYLPASY